MSEVFSKFQPEDFAGLVSVVGGMLMGTVAIIAWFWHKTRKLEIHAALKQDMLNRGMSADEIRTVIESGTVSRLICQRGGTSAYSHPV